MRTLLILSFITVNFITLAQPRVITFESEQKGKDNKKEKTVK